MIEITSREMNRAYRDHYKAYTTLTKASFSGRTCLFYAAECGLKWIIMRRENGKTTMDIAMYDFGHNLNKMLSHLRCEKALHTPKNITLKPLHHGRKKEEQRDAVQSELNQVWRYGVNMKEDKMSEELINALDSVC